MKFSDSAKSSIELFNQNINTPLYLQQPTHSIGIETEETVIPIKKVKPKASSYVKKTMDSSDDEPTIYEKCKKIVLGTAYIALGMATIYTTHNIANDFFNDKCMRLPYFNFSQTDLWYLNWVDNWDMDTCLNGGLAKWQIEKAIQWKYGELQYTPWPTLVHTDTSETWYQGILLALRSAQYGLYLGSAALINKGIEKVCNVNVFDKIASVVSSYIPLFSSSEK